MKKEVGLEQFTPVNATVTKKDDSIYLFNVSSKGGYAKIPVEDIKDAKYLVFDVKNLSDDLLLRLHLTFWAKDEDEASMTFAYAFFPKLLTRLVLPLSALDNQKMFLPRTPGRLKCVVGGNAILPEEVAAIGIGGPHYYRDQAFEVSNIYFTDEEPEYLLPTDKIVDELGQWKNKEWQGKTKSVEEMVTVLKKESEEKVEGFGEGFSRWGGWLDKYFGNDSGFFRTHKEGDRWWLVDPDGYAFFSNGQDCIHNADYSPINGNEGVYTWMPDKDGEFAAARSDVYINDGSTFLSKGVNFAVVNLIRAFGKDWWEKWAKMTKSRMYKWGVNTVGNWSLPEFIEYARMPYVTQYEGFPTTNVRLFRDFPDVFSPEYEENSRNFARLFEATKDDPCLIGYFMRNEPTWAFENSINIIEGMLASEVPSYTRKEFVDRLTAKYDGDVGRLNEAWGTSFESFEDLFRPIRRASKLSANAERDLRDFVYVMIEKYVSVPAKAIREVDGNHLNLGMRYGYIHEDAMLAGSQYYDVFSLNCYQLSPEEMLKDVHNRIDMPLIIGEFHHGAVDKGLPATGIYGVATAIDRGKAFRYYMEAAAADKWCVGAHHFMLNDQPIFGRHDGENFNIGIVDICNRPYDEMVDALLKLKSNMYKVADGQLEPYNEKPVSIPRVGL